MDRNSFWSIAGKGIAAGLGAIVLIFALSGCGKSGQSTPDSVLQADAVKKDGQEIFYDDGLPEAQHSPWTDETGGQLAVVFTPTFYPAALIKVRFLVGINGVPSTEFRVRVFGATVSGGPDENQDLLSSEMTASAPFGNKWIEVDLSDQDVIITGGDFSVAMEWLTPPGVHGENAQFIGVDYGKPDRRSWWKTDFRSGWERIEEVANVGDRDVMIRATIVRK